MMRQLFAIGFISLVLSPLAVRAEIEEREAKEFICPERFSVISKYIFTKYYERGLETPFHYNLYRETLKVMSPGFREGTSQIKTSYQAYLSEFKKLISSLKREGFNANYSIIPYKPLSSDNDDPYFIDGEHRIGASLYLGTPVLCQLMENHPINAYDSQLFLSHKVDRKYLDFMAINYAKLKPTCRIVLLFSKAARSPNRALKLLKDYGRIVYQKPVVFNQLGARNLVKMLYENDSRTSHQYWLLDTDQGKASGITANAPVSKFIAILWEGKDLDSNRECKQKIRESYPPFSHDTVHITDDPFDTLYAAQSLFNQNSVDFLNAARPKKFENFLLCAQTLKRYIQEMPELEENYVIDTSAVLAALGIRDCNDLDVVCPARYEEIFKKMLVGKIDIHNQERRQYGYKLDDLIYNPENYFYYKGIKFISIPNLIRYKSARNSAKDRADVKRLEKVVKEIRAIEKL